MNHFNHEVRIIKDSHAVAGIPIEVFIERSQVPFNIYVKLNDKKYVLVSAAESPILQDKIKSYIEKGVKYLYVLIEDKDSILHGVKRIDAINKEIKKTDTSNSILHERANEVREMATTTLAALSNDQMKKLTPEVMKSSVKITENLVDLMSKDYNLVEHFLQISESYDYFKAHAIGCTAFSIALVQYLTTDFHLDGLGSPNGLKSMGLAALLHDIGKKMVSKDILNKASILTEKEHKEVQAHVTHSCRLLEDTIAMDPRVYQIILQHHENCNGTGYPNNLKAKEICVGGKILRIIDSFVAMILDKPHKKKYSVEKALELMFMEEGVYDQEILNKLFEMFKEKIDFLKDY